MIDNPPEQNHEDQEPIAGFATADAPKMRARLGGTTLAQNRLHDGGGTAKPAEVVASIPNPASRPEGSLVLNFFSDVPNGTDPALGKIPQRNAVGGRGATSPASSTWHHNKIVRFVIFINALLNLTMLFFSVLRGS
jgi:hypothetical protein